MTLMLLSSGPMISLRVETGPNGPTTLHQRIRLQDRAVASMEDTSEGRGMVAPGTVQRAKQRQESLHARMERLLLIHPELQDLNARHEELLNTLSIDGTQEKNIDNLQQQCAELARKIVGLENNLSTLN